MWAPDYVTLAELKKYVDVDGVDVADDDELALAATGASRAVDDHCNRQFGKVDAPEERTYPVWFNRRLCRWVANIDDLQTTTGLVLTPTDYVLEPRNAVAEGLAWTRLVFSSDPGAEVDVTAPWGWTAFPPAVKLASLLQGSRLSHRRDSPYGVAGSPQMGSELRLLARVDPDVAVLLRRYRKRRAVG